MHCQWIRKKPQAPDVQCSTRAQGTELLTLDKLLEAKTGFTQTVDTEDNGFSLRCTYLPYVLFSKIKNPEATEASELTKSLSSVKWRLSRREKSIRRYHKNWKVQKAREITCVALSLFFIRDMQDGKDIVSKNVLFQVRNCG